MPLYWDVKNVKNYEVVTTNPLTRGTGEEKWHSVTDAIVMLSMMVGFREITEQNYKKIAQRLAAYQFVAGAYLAHTEFGEIYITEEDVKLHIGLKVNVTPKSTAEFRKALLSIIDRDSTIISSGSRNAFLGNKTIVGEDLSLSAYEINERLAKKMKEEGK